MRRRTFLRIPSALPLATTTITLTAATAATAASLTDAVAADVLPGRAAVLESVRRVNDHWINAHTDPGDNLWARATYFSGDLAAYRLTGERRYLAYAESWAEKHDYGLAGGVTTRHADHHNAGQVYLDLHEARGGEERIAAIESSLHRMVHTDRPEKTDDWWWADALYMAMPSMARLGALRGDTAYWAKMYALYHHTKRVQGGGLYDYTHELWYRDGTWSPGGSGRLSPDGRPVFWSRGNGWAYAAHAKVLSVLPSTDKRAPEYRWNMQGISRALLASQRPDGFWNPSLGDPRHLPGKESSGTALFCYGLAYAIRTGLIDRSTYLPVLARGWNALVRDAVHPDGRLGWVQGTGDRPESSRPITYETTADFAVGAFLMAGSQVARLAP
ncbi:glycoside hydrolase family 88 protein [Kitasatospora sp. NPDC002965]|uniref:glycoside hydrolase family 88 protein n=1 Tax=Kitasatospora sp. NPDC002965 TaxID=3154775 RepID=UPI0033B1668C